MLKLAKTALWILDEPLTNLDAGGRALILDWVRDHVDEGGTAIVATHQPKEFSAASGSLLIEL
jgi:heme exporter protein A